MQSKQIDRATDLCTNAGVSARLSNHIRAGRVLPLSHRHSVRHQQGNVTSARPWLCSEASIIALPKLSMDYRPDI